MTIHRSGVILCSRRRRCRKVKKEKAPIEWKLTENICLFSLSPQDEDQGGEEGEGWSQADRSSKEEESAQAGRAEKERPEETDPVHQERSELPVLPAGQPRVQLPHHGPQGRPAAAADVHSQVGQEEQGAQVRHQVHEVPSVPHLPHCLPVTQLAGNLSPCSNPSFQKCIPQPPDPFKTCLITWYTAMVVPSWASF